MLNNTTILIRTESIRRHPLSFSTIQILMNMNKDQIAILNGADNLNLTLWMTLKEICKEGCKSFFPVRNTCRMLDIGIPYRLGLSLRNSSVLNGMDV
ncbi:Uncharacterised protein [Streptococcus pneumoniae]|nr:Uncharacterised protein [Streptococcus pneumoniae]